MRTGPTRFLLSQGMVLLLLTFSLLQARPSHPLAQDAGASPRKWEVRLLLKADGDYRLEEGGPSAAGYFSFSVHWTGWLEKDDHDYLLYRLDCRLGDWKAREVLSYQDATEVLTTNDFPAKPGFNLKYFIRVGNSLRLDFLVDGLTVPLGRDENAFPLLLPASEQNGQRISLIDYNDGVFQGSNRVEVAEAEIYSGSVNKTYSWAWKNQQWLLKSQRTVFTSQSHQVKVILNIIPLRDRSRQAR
ncbi:MAG: hypothetical protein JXE07_09170 [Candidatus Aminicenantes bacterium]|nr:hypothetical protein [Candidatus Aminicenantes bacterium]